MKFLHIIYLVLCFNLFECQVTRTSRGDNDIVDHSTSFPHNQKSQKMSTDQNGKPMFKDCENYKPSVKEEQPPGTNVITVRAEDHDPIESGGNVSYKIVKREGERAYFTINNQTGEVKTNLQFDRDEPVRQKELYLTVQATDNGRPPLADICTFKVTVIDINDNAPSFDVATYNAHVSEELQPKSEVMRVFSYDVDDGENSKLTYSFQDNMEFGQYFRIDPKTGVVYLQQSLMNKKDRKFTNVVIVSDNGKDKPLSANADVAITVVGSDKHPPKILNTEPASLTLKENYNQFSTHLVTIEAESSIDDKEVVFELVKGKTAQTNKDQTFLLTPSDHNDNIAYISLVRPLDYETVTEYTLTVRVKNKEFMDTSVNIPITITDVNDETPNFIELLKGSVVENDDPGVQAMQVRAIDKDGTVANNVVSYELLSHQDIFSIDAHTGIIKSEVKFDREETNLYHVKVKASDNSPSAILATNESNSVIQTFQISIEDRNDNVPQFSNSVYIIHNISESADIGKDVVEVVAYDKDTASLILYSITDGNIGNVFSMENTTGRIKVNGRLDYEKIQKYELTVTANDGIYEDTAKVMIYIQNENDERPVFESHNKEIKLEEEVLVDGCIIQLKAYDPDISDRQANQRIAYVVDKDQRDFLSVNSDGCVRLLKPLDRDKPYGSPSRQVFVYAYDNDGSQNSLSQFTEIRIVLEDINDNAPFLNVTEYVWYENRAPDVIGYLSADDYDSPKNGPPFTFAISDSAPADIQDKFSVDRDGKLSAKVEFDREETKYYDISVTITDNGSPEKQGISILRVIIGDENDNAAKDGVSEIFVYKYYGIDEDIAIGRVYVEDKDDWDLNDKMFVKHSRDDQFELSRTDNGMILMKPNVAAGVYTLYFDVTEASAKVQEHTVHAKVNVTVKEIPEEAVRKSGSIRMHRSTIEQFVEKELNELSRKDVLQRQLANMLNTSIENVDVFTVLPSPSNSSLIDIRFSAHGSPYYAPERLNNKATEHQDELQRALDVEFVMISISECQNETACPPNYSCSNVLNIHNKPAVVFTNKTSFVGVKAVVERICDCVPRTVNECFNGGTLIENSLCSCPAGFDGPHCEMLSIGFNEEGGWAMYPTFDACNDTEIQLHVLPQSKDGLIFYAGPLTLRHANTYKDFIALELQDGIAQLKINVGKETTMISAVKRKLTVGTSHKIRIKYSAETVEMEIDDCKSQCLELNSFSAGLLNVNGPLQLGGLSYTFNPEESKMIWGHLPPTNQKFVGCIQNFTYKGFPYNLGAPSDQYHAFAGCNYGIIAAVTFGIDSSFLVAILVCIALLIILLLAVVVHRRKQDNINEKDIDDTRENIINYEDEGGGECDTNYDLTVFHTNMEEKPILTDAPDVNADISGFLDNKKDSCDRNPDNLPFDDVRHYAYEGDGNSTGSLSSLASCTDEGDLKFNYLSNFGPRFRKLADMYGEDPSDEDSHDGGEESWC